MFQLAVYTAVMLNANVTINFFSLEHSLAVTLICYCIRTALVAGPEVRSKQRCVHALPQDSLDSSTDPGDVCRQREGREHGGVVERRWNASGVRQQAR